jgi:hypothetical protein
MVDHCPAHFRSSCCQIFVHNDHIDWTADPSDSVAQADSLRDAVLNATLDHQEVQIAVPCHLSPGSGSEQDHPSRRSRSVCQPLPCKLDQLLGGHDEDSLPTVAE